MQPSEARKHEIFDGLKLLADTAFPKQCPGCSKVYPDLAQFLEHTTPVDGDSGLSESALHGSQLVTLARRCGCGRTIAEECDDRRAQDPLGRKRRELFERLLSLLCESGMPAEVAKRELLKVMKGGSSELLSSTELSKFFS